MKIYEKLTEYSSRARSGNVRCKNRGKIASKLSKQISNFRHINFIVKVMRWMREIYVTQFQPSSKLFPTQTVDPKLMLMYKAFFTVQ